MLDFFTYLLETRKEIIVGLSLSVLYITYYLVEVVKKPLLICGSGDFRDFLEEHVPLLSERYWPTPWCVESRLQTVIGSILRTRYMPSPVFRREVLVLSDGGTVALDWVDTEHARATLLVLPGLTGSSRADYVRSLAATAAALPATLVVLHQRGLGGIPLTTPRLYCAVSHADVGEVARALAARGGGPLLAVGVSLGGLILGQHLAAEPAGPVRAALVVSSPLDVVKGSECIERPVLNALLSYHMAQSLARTVRRHEPLRDGPWDWTEVSRCRSVREFDAAFTTKHFRFPSVEAYYRAASLADKLHRVRVPTLCLVAADDPFQPLHVMPADQVRSSCLVALAVPARGGHIGFLQGWWPAGRKQYIAELATQYFSALLDRPLALRPPPAPPAPLTPPLSPSLAPPAPLA